jgi:hypothetical protein
MSAAPPRFACDVMLGRTAKWLRMLGFDTFYDNRADDMDLKKLSLAESRVLLTKDVGLAELMPAGTVRLVAAIPIREQLEEIVTFFRLDRFTLPPRCSVCNGELAACGKEQVKDLVPPYVFRSQNNFQRCSNCQKTYWPGSHIGKIATFLETITKPGDRQSC